jgi:dTMP kinase
MDILANRDYYDAFVEYQSHLLAQFEAMSEEFDFHRIDATQNIREVFQALTVEIDKVLADMKPIPPEKAQRELSVAQAEGRSSGRNRKADDTAS